MPRTVKIYIELAIADIQGPEALYNLIHLSVYLTGYERCSTTGNGPLHDIGCTGYIQWLARR